jgi:SAM-dependent methyltransferase
MSIVFLIILLILSIFLASNFHFILTLLFTMLLTILFISLLVSYYVYDVSSLYKLDWLEDCDEKINIVNISAGFDETSSLLKIKFKNAAIEILDFYDPKKHTEVSIKRARKAYPSDLATKKISTSNITIENNLIDKIFVILSAHEIRDDHERICFFNELNRILRPNGEIFITEHLRDIPNFLAYNIGFFHFIQKSTWYKTFQMSKLEVKIEQKITPFITTFTLKKNGISS